MFMTTTCRALSFNETTFDCTYTLYDSDGGSTDVKATCRRRLIFWEWTVGPGLTQSGQFVDVQNATYRDWSEERSQPEETGEFLPVPRSATCYFYPEDPWHSHTELSTASYGWAAFGSLCLVAICLGLLWCTCLATLDLLGVGPRACGGAVSV